MSSSKKHDQHDQHHHRHKDESRLGHMARALDHLTSVVTADLIVDFGVLCTGVILVFLELGLVPHRPFEDHQPPPSEVVVRQVDADTAGH